MKKMMIALTAVSLLAATAAMAKGPGAAGGSATMQRSAAMMTQQLNNQYRHQYQYQARTMTAQGSAAKNAYKQQNQKSAANAQRGSVDAAE